MAKFAINGSCPLLILVQAGIERRALKELTKTLAGVGCWLLRLLGRRARVRTPVVAVGIVSY